MKKILKLSILVLLTSAFLISSCAQNTNMTKVDKQVKEAAESVKKEEKKVIKKDELVISNEVLKKYVGNYELAPSFIITISVEGNRIFAQATGQANVEIYPKSEREFFYKVVDAQIIFTVNKDQVEKLTLYQSGQVLPAKKIK